MSRRLPLSSALLAAPVLFALAAAPVGAQTIRRCLGADGTTIFTDRGCAAFGATDAGEFNPNPGAGVGTPAMMGLDGAVGGFAIRGCARSPDALLHGVRDALMARDVNKLANYYHWTGTGASASVSLMDRLERIATRPLAGVELDYPAQPAWFAPPPEMVASVGAAPERYERDAGVDPRAQAGPAFLAGLRHPDDPEPEVVDAEFLSPDAPLPPPDAAAGGDLDGAVRYPAYSPPAFSPSAPPPRPTGLRVLQASSIGDPGSQSAHFGLRRNAGCWWIQF